LPLVVVQPYLEHNPQHNHLLHKVDMVLLHRVDMVLLHKVDMVLQLHLVEALLAHEVHLHPAVVLAHEVPRHLHLVAALLAHEVPRHLHLAVVLLAHEVRHLHLVAALPDLEDPHLPTMVLLHLDSADLVDQPVDLQQVMVLLQPDSVDLVDQPVVLQFQDEDHCLHHQQVVALLYQVVALHQLQQLLVPLFHVLALREVMTPFPT